MSANFGRKLPITKPDALAIQLWLLERKRWRDLALFTLGIDSLLRASDLLRLQVSNVVDQCGAVRSTLVLRQQKTKRPVECHLSKPTRQAVAHWIAKSGKTGPDYLFTRLKRTAQPDAPISAVMYRLLVKQWVAAIGLDPSRYSTKSLRKSRVRPILEAANNDYQVPQILLGHKDIRSTIHYAAIAEETALACAARVQFFVSFQFEKLPPSSRLSPENIDENQKKSTK